MENKFLAVNKTYFNLGLKSIDILILSQIDEFNRNNRDCYITNQQLSDMFGESVRTVARSLDKLEELGFIKRQTITSRENGLASKVRTISINNNTIKANAKMTFPINDREVPKVAEADAKSLKGKCQNGTIKDKIKDKEEDNYNDKDYSFKKEKLSTINKLMDTLNERNIQYTEQEIIDSCKKMYDSNYAREYKWSSSTLNEYIRYNNNLRDTSFQVVLDDYSKYITDMLSLNYGY